MREQSFAFLRKVVSAFLYAGLAITPAWSGYAQTTNLVRITQPLQISCTAPAAKLNAGTLFVNTCTVTGGSGPYSFSVSRLPKELTAVKTSNSITVSGRPLVGHYEYGIDFSGAGYTTAFGWYGLDIAPAGTYPSGKGVIRCLQKGWSGGADAPLCQTCVISSTGTVCDKDSNFHATGRTPQAPAGALVTAVYLDYAPATFNVQGYTLSVSHKDSTNVTKQIAFQTPGSSAVFATQSAPVIDFDWQSIEADSGRWSFKFAPLMGNAMPGVQWGVDFHYNIDWQVVPNPKGAAAVSGTAPDKEVTEISVESRGSGLTTFDPTAVAGASFQGWNVISAGHLTGDGRPGILVQNAANEAIGMWQTSGVQISGKLAVSTVPTSGWRAVGAADATGDGIPDIFLQDERSGTIEIWQMSGQDVLARTQLPTVPMPGWKVRAVGESAANGGGTEMVLQNEDGGQIAVWKIAQGDVVAKSDLMQVPEQGMRVTALADVTGDGIPDILLQNKDGKSTEVWEIANMQVAAKSALAVKRTAGIAVAAADLSGTGQAGLLMRDPAETIFFLQCVGK